MLHLAKLLTLFNFPDYGMYFQYSVWKADLQWLSVYNFDIQGQAPKIYIPPALP